MPGVGDDVGLGRFRQSEPDRFGIIGMRQHLVVFATPELYRLTDRRQAIAAESKAERGRGGDHRLDPRIVGPDDIVIQRQRVLVQDLANLEGGMRLAVIRDSPQIRLAAGRHQYREAAGGEAERADMVRINALMIAPFAQHVIGKQFELARSRWPDCFSPPPH